MEQLQLLSSIIDTTSGPTLLCCQSRDKNQLVAVKRFNISKPSHEREARKMQKLAKIGGGHENLVQFYDVAKGDRSLNIIMEYCSQGDLYSYLEEIETLPLSEITLKFEQILSGVAHLHKFGFAHRNLSLDNILMDKSGVCKICDFGSITTRSTSKSLVGLERYRAPEITSKRKRYCPFQADVWSLGVILFCLLTRKFPFKNTTKSDSAFNYFSTHGIEELLARYDLLCCVPDQAVDLLEKMLSLDPKQRISLKDVLQHPFINSTTRC